MNDVDNQRCKNCKYWVDLDFPDTNDKTCKHPKIIFGYWHSDKPSADEVVIENDEGWGWKVGPEFGCVHFTQR